MMYNFPVLHRCKRGQKKDIPYSLLEQMVFTDEFVCRPPSMIFCHATLGRPSGDLEIGTALRQGTGCNSTTALLTPTT